MAHCFLFFRPRDNLLICTLHEQNNQSWATPHLSCIMQVTSNTFIKRIKEIYAKI
jgi:hypothetical protein